MHVSRLRRRFVLSAGVTGPLLLLPACQVLPTAWGGGPAAQDSDSFEFALMGDLPYAPTDLEKFDRLIDDINHQPQLRWVLHVGDIKTGSSPCSDAMLSDRLARFGRLVHPFIYTPGDNDWTDCHRAKAGGYQPLERLKRLRELFFPRPDFSLGDRPMGLNSQARSAQYPELVENRRWRFRGVVFATLHIVGSHNGLDGFDPSSRAQRGAADDEEVAHRTAGTVAWLRETFALARDKQAPGVLLAFQANLGLEQPRGHADRQGFEPLIDAIEEEAARFGRPVVLAHGDSHYFRVDKPMISSRSQRRMDNVTRVETFGESDVHWLRVVVRPGSREVFSIHQEVVPGNVHP